MNFAEAVQLIEDNGFLWANFREIFPFGDTSLREARYEKLARMCVNSCKSDSERGLLIDLLDAQACVYLEQVWVQKEQLDDGEESPFVVAGHFASTWLQINSNIRNDYNLARKDGRQAMLNLPPTESLFDRMLVPVLNTEDIEGVK